jgi:glycolate oxidase iron-sulfur subunit
MATAPPSLDLVATAKRSAFHGVDIPNHTDIINCMHCGLCLPHCPTYGETLRERDSPRGRIRLIKTIAEGDLEITPAFAETMSFCLLCRACETACPAGVKYGELAEAARAQIEKSGVLATPGRSFVRALLLRGLIAHPSRLRIVARLMWVGQHTLRPVLRAVGFMRLLPKRLRTLDTMAPEIPAHFTRGILPDVMRPEGEVRGRVGLLQGCLADVTYPEYNHDTAHVLVHHGFEVMLPRGQTCCGSLLGHTGELEAARELAKRNIEVFEKAQIDHLVLNVAGCGSFVRAYDHLFHDDPAWADRAKAFAAKVRDVSEFLAEIGPKEPTVPIRRRLTYHEACHLVHGQGVSSQPRQLLALIPGLEIVELPEATRCCGSAGIYNIARTEDSLKFLKRKMDNVEKTGANLIATGNAGCLAQIQFGCRDRSIDADVVHPISLLREAYGLPGPKGRAPRYAGN